MNESTPDRAKSNALLALWRIALLTGLTTLMLAIQFAAAAVSRTEKKRIERAARWTHLWGRGVARICGLRIRASGPLPNPGSLIAPNHVGYMDVVALAALTPTAFVPKSDVFGWPVVGTLLRASRQIAVKRSASRQLVAANEAIADRLRSGQSVCVFLEGTSSGGDRVLPFHASLLQAPASADAPVVPVALRWHADAPDMSVSEDLAYWKKETPFGPHLFRLFGLSGFGVDVVFAPPIAASGADRKALAARVRSEVVARMDCFPPPALPIVDPAESSRRAKCSTESKSAARGPIISKTSTARFATHP